MHFIKYCLPIRKNRVDHVFMEEAKKKIQVLSLAFLLDSYFHSTCCVNVTLCKR